MKKERLFDFACRTTEEIVVGTQKVRSILRESFGNPSAEVLNLLYPSLFDERVFSALLLMSDKAKARTMNGLEFYNLIVLIRICDPEWGKALDVSRILSDSPPLPETPLLAWVASF